MPAGDMNPRYDVLGPYRGPCAVCGGDDARHRLWDAIRSWHKGGGSVQEIAREYGLPAGVVEQVVEG